MLGETIYYRRVIDGERVQFSLETDDWEQAIVVRDLYERERRVGRIPRPLPAPEVPTFREYARVYLEQDTAHLAETTRGAVHAALRPDGPLVRRFGALRLDRITTAHLSEWWTELVGGRGRAVKTAHNSLQPLSNVLDLAIERKLLDANPVREFRAQVGKRLRTQRGRAATDPARHIRPIEDPADLAKLRAAARKRGPMFHAFVLALLDAGLRYGEARGLRWAAVHWGEDADDLSREVVIDHARPKGGLGGPPKSGRSRTVPLSRRLRLALSDWHRVQGFPEDGYVFPFASNHAVRQAWREIAREAGVAEHTMKDLRDTFASGLLTTGVPIAYVAALLGHADAGATAARHYAKWIRRTRYVEPLRLGPGEVVTDLLARFETQNGQEMGKEVRADPARPTSPAR
jgi:integrase